MDRSKMAAIALLCLGCLAAPSLRAGEPMRRDFEKSVPLRSGGRVEIKNVTGPVTVSGWDREEVRVRALITCDLEKVDDEAREMFEQVEIVVDHDWNLVTVKTKYPDSDNWDADVDKPDIDFNFQIDDDGEEEESAFAKGILGMVGRVVGGVTSWVTGMVEEHLPVQVSYEVSVPSECELELHAVTGDLQVSGVRGNIETGLVTGNTVLLEPDGDLECSVVTGDIELEGARGKIITSAVTGDVTLALARNGDIDGVHCSVVNGDIVLRVPEGRGLDFTFNAVNGDIELELEQFRNAVVRGKRFKGSVMGGGPDIEANAVNGSVRVERAVR